MVTYIMAGPLNRIGTVLHKNCIASQYFWMQKISITVLECNNFETIFT
jgi:hypothetical protein